jgi:hypothetical protein
MSREVLEQHGAEMLREAELNRLEKALQANRRRTATPRWASIVAWELAKSLGLLRKSFRTPKNSN